MDESFGVGVKTPLLEWVEYPSVVIARLGIVVFPDCSEYRQKGAS